MAKLTVYQRNQIVDLILEATGQPLRINTIRDRLVNTFKDVYWAALPEHIQALRNTDCETFLKEKHVDVATGCCCVQVKLPYAYGVHDGVAASAARANMAVKALHREYEAAVDLFRSVKQLTKANVFSCATHAQFRTRFPELAEYLPEGEKPVANLPSTTDFVDRLKAAGLKLGE